MFSSFNETKDFDPQKKEFINHIEKSLDNGFGFMNQSQKIETLVSIDDNIDKQVAYLQKKIEVIRMIPPVDSTFQTVNDESNSMRLFVALGIVRIEADTEKTLRQNMQLSSLDKAKFQKKRVLAGFEQYMEEYINKLKTLKDMSLSNERLPVNNNFQLELQNKLELLLKKTKFYIFDIYLNHYIQYIYLLFAINIFKTSETLLMLNAEKTKLKSILKIIEDFTKVNKLSTQTDSNSTNKLRAAVNEVTDKNQDISNYNKPPNSDDMLEAPLPQSVKQQLGGMNAQRIVSTVADATIKDIMTKHNHFYNVFRKTREFMPQYFTQINGMINEKIGELRRMKDDIVKLNTDQIKLIQDTTDKMAKLMNDKSLSAEYNHLNHPVMVDNIRNRMQVIAQNELSRLMNLKKDSAAEVQREMDTINQMFSNSNRNINPNSNSGYRTQPSSYPSQGGFVRGRTQFPSNNYKILEKHIRTTGRGNASALET